MKYETLLRCYVKFVQKYPYIIFYIQTSICHNTLDDEQNILPKQAKLIMG